MERNQQRLVIALASALVLAVVAIAFLLGRISSAPTVVTVAVPAQSAGTSPAQRAPAVEAGPAPITADAPPASAPPVAEPTGLVLKIP